MKQADFFTNVSLMVSCHTPELFNARFEGQHAQIRWAWSTVGKFLTSRRNGQWSKVTKEGTKMKLIITLVGVEHKIRPLICHLIDVIELINYRG